MATKTKAQLQEEVKSLNNAVEDLREELDECYGESDHYVKGHQWAETCLPELKEVLSELTCVRDTMWMKLSKPLSATQYAEMAIWGYHELEGPCMKLKGIIEDAE